VLLCFVGIIRTDVQFCQELFSLSVMFVKIFLDLALYFDYNGSHYEDKYQKNGKRTKGDGAGQDGLFAKVRDDSFDLRQDFAK